jgi:hypothetical protein
MHTESIVSGNTTARRPAQPPHPGRSTVPITVAAMRSLSAKWLFPGVVALTVASSQDWLSESIVPYVLTFVTYLSAVILVVTTFRRKRWPTFLVMCILLARAFELVSPTAEIAYYVFLNMLFCAAGAVIVTRYPNLIYKQVMIICLLNVAFMIMQVTGVGGKSSQFLTTHGVSERRKQSMYEQPAPVLFVPEEDIEASLIQARPAGLSHSNIILSLIVLFGLTLHLSRDRNRFAWGTLLLCVMAVLSMAKIVFLGFTLIFLYLMFAGTRGQRWLALKALAIMTVFLILYSVFFPGLFAINLSWFNIGFSFFVRLSDVGRAFGPGSFFQRVLNEALAPLERYLEYYAYRPRQFAALEFQQIRSQVTGWSSVVNILPYLVASSPVLAFFFFRGFRRQRSRLPHLTCIARVALIVIAVYPAAFPVWPLAIYWFIAGFGLLPFFVLLEPGYFKDPLRVRYRSARPRLTSAQQASPTG